MKFNLFVAMMLLAGCTTTGNRVSRIFLDSPTHKDSSPEWVKKQKASWDSGGDIFFRTAHTIKGNERINACYDLAKLDAKETLLTELSTDIRGRIDNAQTSISESSEIILGKARSEEFQGRIIGLKTDETWFERYNMAGEERIDCFLLSKINKSDYNRVKREVVDRLKEVDPRIKEAVAKKQIEFFDRNPSSDESPKTTKAE